MSMNAIIIEDEQYSVLNLTQLLKKYVPDMNVIQVFESGRDALKNLPGLDFDLIFLDIQFNDDFDAFDMLKALQFDQLHIIFVTSFNDYALKAFKFNAIDYVTKPIDKDDLLQAINKAKDKILRKKELDQLFNTIHAFRNKQIAIRDQGETIFLPTDRICYLKAEKEYSIVYFMDEKGEDRELISSKHLGFWENELSSFPFLRIHKSFLVNIDQVQSFGNKKVKLINGTKLDISRDRRKTIEQKIIAHKTL